MWELRERWGRICLVSYFHFSFLQFHALLASLADPDDCPGDLNFDFHSNLPSFYVSLTLSQNLDCSASEAMTDGAFN